MGSQAEALFPLHRVQRKNSVLELFSMPKVIIKKEKCKACGLCIEVCPKKILRLSTDVNKLGYNPVECTDESLCILCKACATVCPDVVFTLKKD